MPLFCALGIKFVLKILLFFLLVFVNMLILIHLRNLKCHTDFLFYCVWCEELQTFFAVLVLHD